MPPACDRSEALLYRYVNDGSEEELSDEERVQTIQEEIGEFEESHTVDEPCPFWAQPQTSSELGDTYTNNEDPLEQEMVNIMPPACDRSEALLYRYVNDGSEEELSDEERVQTIQEEIGEFEESHTVDEPCPFWAQPQTSSEPGDIYTKNEDPLEQEMLSNPERWEDEIVDSHLTLQKRQNERRKRVRQIRTIDSSPSQNGENEEHQEDTNKKAEMQEHGHQIPERAAAMFDRDAQTYIQLDLEKQQKLEKVKLDKNHINYETSKYLHQRLAKLRDLEPKRREQKANAENEPTIETQAQQQAATHAVLAKSHTDLIERQEQERKENMLRNEQINTTMSQYLRGRLELGRLRMLP